MKQGFLYMLMLPLLTVLLAAPAVTFAREGDDDWDDEDDAGSALEIEADIFTDITVVKVEIDDRKSTFSTDADTRESIVAAVAARYSLDADTVDAALELEMEDRASRPQDRGTLNRYIKHDKHGRHDRATTTKMCRDDDRTLAIEADVFTDKTVVKMEFVNAKDEVFTTTATTSAGVVDAVLAQYTTLTRAAVEAALDIEIEDRASRDSDFVIDADCKSMAMASTTPAVVNEVRLAELRARIAELQSMLDRLIGLLRGN